MNEQLNINIDLPKIAQIVDTIISTKRIIGLVIWKNFKMPTIISAIKIGHMQ
jgi:hypothetical protein